MGEILFIAHRIPFPPDRGDKIRSHNILKRLSQMAPVHVATFADDPQDMAEEVELAGLARSYRLVRRVKPLILSGIQAILGGKPVSLTAFYDDDLASYIKDVLATRPITAIYVFSGQMGQYVPADFTGRTVIDFVDVDSAKFDQYAATGSGVYRLIQAREGRKLRAEEARLAVQADVSLLISDAEAKLFTDRLPADVRGTADVMVLRNGVDIVGLDPTIAAPETRMLAFPGPRIVFTGQMDYAPNHAAAMRAIDRIMPLVRAELPDATFHVVGRNPMPELLARDGRDGCHVWGRVKDIRTWLKASDIALIPLDIARGVQNKVLEAMAMSLPAVVTPQAAAGIHATDGEDFVIADGDEALARAVIALVRDPRRARTIGITARQHLAATATWQSALSPLAAIVGMQTTCAVHDAAA